MRPPRYRFPEIVRSTTRSIAARMVRDSTIAQTPDELAAWIDRTPEAREPLEKGGYNEAFTAEDLYPLLQVFIVQAGGPAPQPVDAPPPAAKKPRIGALALVLAVAVAVIVVAVMLLT